MIHVSCAVLIQSKKVLAVRRGAAMKMPGKWEFPGGKVELDETAEAALIREIQEELNLGIAIEKPLSPVEYDYGTFPIRLIPFLVQVVSGELQLIEHDAFLWCNQSQMQQLDWAEADIPIMLEVIFLDLIP